MKYEELCDFFEALRDIDAKTDVSFVDEQGESYTVDSISLRYINGDFFINLEGAREYDPV